MTRTAFLSSTTLLLVALGWGAGLRADDDPAPPPGRPTQEQIRERFKNLTAEERKARLEALRKEGGPGASAADAILKRRAEMEKLRDETKDLPAEQRQARIRQWRETNGFARLGPGAISAEEREAIRTKFKKRIEEQMATLNNRKADGTITQEETRRLQNMSRMLKRLESAPSAATPPAGLPPLGLPPPAVPADKPSKPDEPAKVK